MATADTVQLGPPHEPKEESIKAFKQIEPELKKQLVHLRHEHDKYFASVAHLSDKDLASFTEADLTQVRVGTSAYGIHVFGKVRLPSMPESGPAFIHIRFFSPGSGDEAKLHCIHTAEEPQPGGGFKFRAVFTKDDPLEWFDT